MGSRTDGLFCRGKAFTEFLVYLEYQRRSKKAVVFEGAKDFERCQQLQILFR